MTGFNPPRFAKVQDPTLGGRVLSLKISEEIYQLLEEKALARGERPGALARRILGVVFGVLPHEPQPNPPNAEEGVDARSGGA